ncbi:Cmx/CmrA family chloramphenicol efflux MFS transporter [Streptomyces sp. NPDC032161]|uniref:Cmx/CmrA family chloramphenicol efflux MFS transporter n=1 Tax=unclassified Streptomyces TaxID=2593676 RepID=UPI0033D98EE5
MPVLVYHLAIAVFAQGTSEFMLAGLISGIAAELGISLGTAGLLTSGFALGMVIGAPLMAVVARKLPSRWTLTGFLTLFIAAHVVGALSSDFSTLFLTRVLAALAHSGFLAVTMSSIVRLVAPQRRARALSVILGGTTLALIAGVPAGALVGGLLGWRASLWGVAALCVPAACAILFAMPGSAAPADPGAAPASAPAPTLRAELAALGQAPLLQSIALAALANAATFCTFTYLAAVAIDGAGLEASLMPLVLALFGVGAFVGVLLAGRIGDRHWRPLIGFGAPLLLASWIGFGFASGSAAGLWLFTPALGALSFAVGSALIARVLASAQDAPTMGGSYSTAALNLGAIAGPAIGGLAYVPLGPVGPIAVSAAFVLLTVIVNATPCARAAEATPPG